MSSLGRLAGASQPARHAAGRQLSSRVGLCTAGTSGQREKSHVRAEAQMKDGGRSRKKKPGSSTMSTCGSASVRDLRQKKEAHAFHTTAAVEVHEGTHI